MTYEEALKTLRYEIEEEGHCSYIEEEMKLAMNALEKQIPKKAIPHKVEASKIKIGNANWCKGTTIYTCPCCSTFVSCLYDYCYKCGQALDWGESE